MFASAICFIYLSDSVVIYLPIFALDIRSGFSHKTMLSFKRPLSFAYTTTCVGWLAFLIDVVSGIAIIFGLYELPTLF